MLHEDSKDRRNYPSRPIYLIYTWRPPEMNHTFEYVKGLVAEYLGDRFVLL
jgi:hypothetical protein